MGFENGEFRFGKLSVLQLAKRYSTPLYVYEAETIRDNYRSFARSVKYPGFRIYYACKANANPAILRLIRQLGGNLEAVSEGEVLLALKAGFEPGQIIYTCNGIEENELKFLIKKKIRVNLDSLGQLEKWGRLNPGSDVSLRLNLDIGAGNHAHTTTGGGKSKFGIHWSQIETAKRIASKYKLTIIGVQQHIGSGITSPETFGEAAKKLLSVAHRFSDLKVIDFGGGFNIPYRPEQKPLNMPKLGRTLTKIMHDFAKDYGRKVEAAVEPGRYLVGQAGTLLVKVTDIKTNPSRTFVSVNSGFNHLVRVALYSAYHQVINVTRTKGPRRTVTVVGNLCESGDIFAQDRRIVLPKEGDVLAILDTGAYGFAMSSLYNARVQPAEVMIDRNKARLVRKRRKLTEALPYF